MVCHRHCRVVWLNVSIRFTHSGSSLGRGNARDHSSHSTCMEQSIPTRLLKQTIGHLRSRTFWLLRLTVDRDNSSSRQRMRSTPHTHFLCLASRSEANWKRSLVAQRHGGIYSRIYSGTSRAVVECLTQLLTGGRDLEPPIAPINTQVIRVHLETVISGHIGLAAGHV